MITPLLPLKKIDICRYELLVFFDLEIVYIFISTHLLTSPFIDFHHLMVL